VTLRQKIELEIHDHGPIPFSRYMELCLYDRDLGYYSRRAGQFGKAGDFYTSSDVHAVFGRLLARQFEEAWRLLGSPGRIEVLELGPGRGLFARDVLDWSERKFRSFFDAVHYSLAERSPALRDHLQTTLARYLTAGKASLCSAGLDEKIIGAGDLTWLGRRSLPADVPVVFFTNEFFDALPVEVLSPLGSLRIAVKNGRFVETWVRASPQELEFLDRYGVHPEPGERVEVPLLAQTCMAHLVQQINSGLFIAIDYGYTRPELLAGRHRDTIIALRQHSVSANPYQAPGEQDITAHVNFTALTAAVEQNGMHAQPVVTQAQFLLGIGEENEFADAFEPCRLPQEHAKVALQLKHLVTPAGMGETFQVLVAGKSLSPEQVATLSGLSFGKHPQAARR
jgi:SAM-dependent MidA family methyltransferase